MENTFNVDKHEQYKEVLKYLDIPIIDKELKKSKLWSLMGDKSFLRMEEEAGNHEDPNSVYVRYTRQFGLPFRVKTRKLNIEKKYNLYDLMFNLALEKDLPIHPFTHSEENINKYKVIDHFGIHFDRPGELFHFLPTGVKHGESEYNKEICSYDWKMVNLNDGKPFFTVMSIDDVKHFCEKWNKKYTFQLEGTNGELFAEVLTYWLL